MLVVVHNRYVECLLKTFLDIETFRRLDVLKVYTAKCRSNLLYSFAELLRIFLGNLDVEYVDAAIYLEQKSLAFHHRLATHSAYVAQTEHGCTVRDNSYKVAFVGIFVHIVRVLLNFQTRKRNAWRVGETKVGLCMVRLCRLYFNLSRAIA